MTTKTSPRHALLICLLTALSLIVPTSPAAAQVTTTKPIKVKIKTQKQKREAFHGDVMSFTKAAITVRDKKNFNLLRTFSYTPQLTRKLENRHIEPGQKVTVHYLHGSDVALDIKGKLQKE